MGYLPKKKEHLRRFAQIVHLIKRQTPEDDTALLLPEELDEAKPSPSPFLELPAELRNLIYDYCKSLITIKQCPR